MRDEAREGREVGRSLAFRGALVFLLLLCPVCRAASQSRRDLIYARLLTDNGLYSVAAHVYQAFLAEHPDHPQVERTCLRLGRLYIEQGRLDAALRTFKQFLKRYSYVDAQHEAHYWLGQVRFARGDWTRALAHYAEVVAGAEDKVGPCYVRSQYRAACCMARLGRTREAAARLRTFIALYPGLALTNRARLALAECGMALGRFDEARGLCRAVQSGSKDETTRARAVLKTAVAAYKQGQFAETVKTIDELIPRVHAPDVVAEAVWWKSRAHAGMGDTAEATAALRELLGRHARSDFARQAARELGADLLRIHRAPPQTGAARAPQESPVTPVERLCAARAAFAAGDYANARLWAGSTISHDNTGDLVPAAGFLSALCLARQGRTRAAAAAFEQVAARHPWSPLTPAALFNAGHERLARGQLDAARTALEKLPVAYPDFSRSALARLLLAEVAFREGRYAEAAKAFDAFAATSPEAVEVPLALVRAADAYARAGHLDRAESRCRRVITDFPRTPWAPSAALGVAEILAAEGRHKRAQEEFRALLSPGRSAAIRARARFRLGWIVGQRRDFNAALREYEAAEKLLPNSSWAPELLLRKALLLYRLDRDDRAERALDSLVARHPNYVLPSRTYAWLAARAFERGDHARAGAVAAIHLRHYEKDAAAAAETEQSLFLLGHRHARAAKWERALDAYNRLLDRFPTSRYLFRATLDRTRCLRQLGRSDEAIDPLRALVPMTRGRMAAEVLCELGETYEQGEDWARAAGAYRGIVGKEEALQEPDLCVRACLALGRCEERLGNTQAAIKAYRRALSMRPRSAQALRRRTECEQRLKALTSQPATPRAPTPP